MKMVKVTLEVYLDADGVDDEELRAGESYTVETVGAATGVALRKEFDGAVSVLATKHEIVERSTFDLATGRRIG